MADSISIRVPMPDHALLKQDSLDLGIPLGRILLESWLILLHAEKNSELSQYLPEPADQGSAAALGPDWEGPAVPDPMAQADYEDDEDFGEVLVNCTCVGRSESAEAIRWHTDPECPLGMK